MAEFVADKPLRFETLAIHGGQHHDPTTGAVSVPIYQTSTYAQHAPGEHQGFEYSRSQNPTRFALERAVAALERGRFGFCFASGCAAATTILQTLDVGDHVIAGDDLYGGTYRLFERVMKRRGQRFSFVDLRDPSQLEAAFEERTRLVWLETPTNPMLRLADIRGVCALAHARGIRVVVDNTFASPVLQNPLALGADLVVHSTTKYIGGHADVVGGAVVTRDPELADTLAFLQNACGAVPGPQDCFLTLRGLKTLALRVERQCHNATHLAAWLERHPAVRTTIYPGLVSHPQHALAKQQMRGMGGMITVELDTDLAGCRRFLAALRIFTLAESLGGVESLIEHPALMTHASVPAATRRALGIGDGLVRLSIGIEHLDDLVADLDAALAGIRP